MPSDEFSLLTWSDVERNDSQLLRVILQELRELKQAVESNGTNLVAAVEKELEPDEDLCLYRFAGPRFPKRWHAMAGHSPAAMLGEESPEFEADAETLKLALAELLRLLIERNNQANATP